ncbi:hypothetical protein M877_37615 [Streptomyces niveus NCIMB 11891]|nr:hypothetical protein M877_37615 [Streptomyces niveus NCIMB 11891]
MGQRGPFQRRPFGLSLSKKDGMCAPATVPMTTS